MGSSGGVPPLVAGAERGAASIETTVENGGGEGGVTEVPAPGAELDVGGHRGGDLLMPAVDEVEERVGSRVR